jgi:hypothetical protein
MKLEEIKRLCEAATPGPWRVTEYPKEEWGPSDTIEGDIHGATQAWERTICDDTQYYPTAPGLADVRFIAAARDLVPKLLAVAEAAESIQHNAECSWDPCDCGVKDLRTALAALEASP